MSVGGQEVDLETPGPGGLVRVGQLVGEEIPPGERQQESGDIVLSSEVHCNTTITNLHFSSTNLWEIST